VASIFFILWIAPYIALIIYVVLAVLIQTQKHTENTESTEPAGISRKGRLLTIEGSKKGPKDAYEEHRARASLYRCESSVRWNVTSYEHSIATELESPRVSQNEARSPAPRCGPSFG
jgi:hypothetical protein